MEFNEREENSHSNYQLNNLSNTWNMPLYVRDITNMRK